MNDSMPVGRRSPHYAPESEAQRKMLSDSAAAWIGTPFRKGSAVKGAGVDCIRLADAIYRDSAFETGFDPKKVKYSLDGGRHCKKSKVLTWVESSENFDRSKAAPEFGDLVVFKMGGVGHHVGVMVGPVEFVHAIKHHGVIRSNIGDATWKKRIEFIFKPMSIIFKMEKPS